MPGTDDAVVESPSSFDARLAAIDHARRGTARRWHLGTAVLALVAACVVVPVGVHEYRHHLGPASVSVVGAWRLQTVDHDGRPTVTTYDLGDDGNGVALQFARNGKFQMGGGCVTNTGTYHVSTDNLWFGETGAPAMACGYATAEAERISTSISAAVNAVLEHGAVVSAPASGHLDITVGDGAFVLHYVHSRSP